MSWKDYLLQDIEFYSIVILLSSNVDRYVVEAHNILDSQF